MGRRGPRFASICPFKANQSFTHTSEKKNEWPTCPLDLHELRTDPTHLSSPQFSPSESESEPTPSRKRKASSRSLRPFPAEPVAATLIPLPPSVPPAKKKGRRRRPSTRPSLPVPLRAVERGRPPRSVLPPWQRIWEGRGGGGARSGGPPATVRAGESLRLVCSVPAYLLPPSLAAGLGGFRFCHALILI
jgi:hypothetical protein